MNAVEQKIKDYLEQLIIDFEVTNIKVDIDPNNIRIGTLIEYRRLDKEDALIINSDRLMYKVYGEEYLKNSCFNYVIKLLEHKEGKCLVCQEQLTE